MPRPIIRTEVCATILNYVPKLDIIYDILSYRREMSTNPMIVFTLGTLPITIGAHTLGPYINFTHQPYYNLFTTNTPPPSPTYGVARH